MREKIWDCQGVKQMKSSVEIFPHCLFAWTFVTILFTIYSRCVVFETLSEDTVTTSSLQKLSPSLSPSLPFLPLTTLRISKKKKKRRGCFLRDREGVLIKRGLVREKDWVNVGEIETATWGRVGWWKKRKKEEEKEIQSTLRENWKCAMCMHESFDSQIQSFFLRVSITCKLGTNFWLTFNL